LSFAFKRFLLFNLILALIGFGSWVINILLWLWWLLVCCYFRNRLHGIIRLFSLLLSYYVFIEYLLCI